MKYTAYATRKETDKFFIPNEGSTKLKGKLPELIEYVEKEQLCDPKLWALFVEQFRQGDVDDHDKGWRCEYWGKMMRGACFTYSYTQNEGLYIILEQTVRDLLTTSDKFGRISTYSVPMEFNGWDIWGRKYVMLGLQYFLEICKDDILSDIIVKKMCAHADYIMQKIGKNAIGKIPVTNTSEWWGGMNSTSVLEPFVRLYNITGEKKYLDFSKDLIETGGTRDFNIFTSALEGKRYPYEYPVTKAYEMMSCFEGIIEYYRATKEKKYLTIALNFANSIIESDITVIGSAGTTHELFDHSVIHQFDPKFKGIMQETCVTVTWMKFCYQLLCLTGESKYADHIEISAYNALAGSVNINKNPINQNQVFTFDSYSPLLNGIRGRKVGGYKDLIKDTFWFGCCVAIGAAGTGLVGMSATMPAVDGAVLNLFMQGKSTVNVPLGTVTLTTETEYPKSGDVTITVSTDTTEQFSIYIRIPEWSKETNLFINGEKQNTKSGEYAVIKRVWHTGDIIKLSLDMRTKIIKACEIDENADSESLCHCALKRGPVMLALDSKFGTDVTKAVSIKDNNGYATVKEASDSPFKCNMHYKVELNDKEYLDVADYSSCGQTWEKDMPMSVWITTK